MADQRSRRGKRAKRAEVDRSTAAAPRSVSSSETAAAEPASTAAPREPSEREVSERLCVGCRRTVPREELMRLAISPDAPYLAPDPQRKLGGRGVSVHPTRACVELAAKKGGFARAFKRGVAIDARALCDAAAAHYERRAESLLLAAARRRKLAIGTDAVRAALRTASIDGAAPESSPVEALIVAADAEGRREELQAHAARLGRRCTVLGSKGSLGRLFGRDEVGVLGVLDRGIADEVVRCAAHAAELKSPEGSSPEGSSPGRNSASAGQGERGDGGAPARVSEAE